MKFKNYEADKETISIRLIKLVSGESIICRAPGKKGTTLTIHCPMSVLEIATDLQDNESAYVMAPWIPFAADQTMELNKTAVILIAEVHEDMANEYLERVNEFVNGGPEPEEDSLVVRRQCDHKWTNSDTCDEASVPSPRRRTRPPKRPKGS